MKAQFACICPHLGIEGKYPIKNCNLDYKKNVNTITEWYEEIFLYLI